MKPRFHYKTDQWQYETKIFMNKIFLSFSFQVREIVCEY